MPAYNPQMGPQGYAGYPGAIPSPNWAALAAAQAQALRGAPVGPPAPDVAAANAQATANNAQAAAAAQAAAGGIQNQKDEDLMSAVLALQGQSPKQAALARQVKLADAIRNRGASLNTGSVNGAAPNWAGALADAFGGYMAGKQDKAAQAGADALAGETQSAARRYFDALRNAPRGRPLGDD